MRSFLRLSNHLPRILRCSALPGVCQQGSIAGVAVQGFEIVFLIDIEIGACRQTVVHSVAQLCESLIRSSLTG